LIAYFSKEETPRVISVPNGESREVVKVTGRDNHSELAWSPGSDEIAYTSNGRIWKVLLSDGIPHKVEAGFDGRASNMDWSPNGETFVFTADTGGETALVLMEDFLAVLNDN
jgi:Tol biopolymer transport system component